MWNTLRPASIREEENARHAVPQQTFPWIHVDDLAVFVADVATGVVSTSADLEQGLIEGGCTAVNVAGGPAELRDYYETVTGALGVEPHWDDGPAWTGQFLVGRARKWGWTPAVELAQALKEIDEGLRG